jgi:hypothetical protein
MTNIETNIELLKERQTTDSTRIAGIQNQVTGIQNQAADLAGVQNKVAEQVEHVRTAVEIAGVRQNNASHVYTESIIQGIGSSPLFPMTRAQLFALGTEEVYTGGAPTTLEYYDLSTSGGDVERLRRLVGHLGVIVQTAPGSTCHEI